MKAPAIVLSILMASCTNPATDPAGDSGQGMDSVMYRGERISLSRTYSDFDEYKDDENNLPAHEMPKVAALVRSAPVASAYPSREAAFDALYDLMFPGYGFSAMNLGEPVVLFALEIPRAGEQRYFAFAQKADSWILVDDFIWPDAGGLLNAAELGDGRVLYRDHTGQVVRDKVL